MDDQPRIILWASEWHKKSSEYEQVTLLQRPIYMEANIGMITSELGVNVSNCIRYRNFSHVLEYSQTYMVNPTYAW